MNFVTHDLTHLRAAYGYWAVLIFMDIESIGINNERDDAAPTQGARRG